MSNVRINALTATAVTPNYDDYFVIDGNTYGTRNILATTALSSITGYGPMSFSGNVTVSGKITASQNIQLGDNYNLTWGGEYGSGYPTIVGYTGAGSLSFYPNGSATGAVATVYPTGLNVSGVLNTFASGSTIGTIAQFNTLNASNISSAISIGTYPG